MINRLKIKNGLRRALVFVRSNRKYKVIGSAVAIVFLFPVIFIAFQNMMAPPIGNPLPTPRPTIAPLRTPTPTPTPTATPISGTTAIWQYISSTPNFDANHIASLATSYGYQVVTHGTLNAAPFSMTIQTSTKQFLLGLGVEASVTGPKSGDTQSCIAQAGAAPIVIENTDGKAWTIPSTYSSISFNLANMVTAQYYSTLNSSLNSAMTRMNSDLKTLTTPTTIFPSFSSTTSGAGPGASTFSIQVVCKSPLVDEQGNTRNAQTAKAFNPAGNPMYIDILQINCAYVGNANIQNVLYHEMGHILGFGDNYLQADAGWEMFFTSALNIPIVGFSPQEQLALTQMYSTTAYPMPSPTCITIDTTSGSSGGSSPNPTPTSGCTWNGTNPASCGAACQVTCSPGNMFAIPPCGCVPIPATPTPVPTETPTPTATASNDNCGQPGDTCPSGEVCVSDSEFGAGLNCVPCSNFGDYPPAGCPQPPSGGGGGGGGVGCDSEGCDE